MPGLCSSSWSGVAACRPTDWPSPPRPSRRTYAAPPARLLDAGKAAEAGRGPETPLDRRGRMKLREQPSDLRDALDVAAGSLGLTVRQLEKDYWVSWWPDSRTSDTATTNTLFGTTTTGSTPSSPSTTSGTSPACIFPGPNRNASDDSRSTVHAATGYLHRWTSLAPSAASLHAPGVVATATARQSSQPANACTASRRYVAT